MIRSLGCFIVILLFTLSPLLAQTPTTGHESKKSDINFTKAATHYKKHHKKHVIRQHPANETPEHAYTGKKLTHEDSAKIHRIQRDTTKPRLTK